MIRRSLRWLQLPAGNPSRSQFLLFVLTGGVAALVNVASRVGFSRLMRFEWAVLAAYAIGMVTAYLLARRFVFPNSVQSLQRSLPAFALVNLIAVLQTWLVSLGVRSLLLPLLGVTALVDLIAHGCGVAVPVFTSFYGHKHLSFRERRSLRS